MEVERILCFDLGRQVFAFPLSLVQEIVPLFPITKVFHTIPAIAGVINLRGRIVAVLDASTLMGIGRTNQTKNTRLILIGSPAHDGAILADAIRGIRILEARPTPVEGQIGALGDYVTGILHLADGPVVLLDPERILDAEPLEAFR